MTLPLRIELAMTFKAVFPDISGPGPIRTWMSFGQRSGCGPQHTDFADLCQRFTGSRDGWSRGANRSAFAMVDACEARRSISLGLRILDGLRVVRGEVGRHRKCSRLHVIDAAPTFDPWRLVFFTLLVKGQADHDVATVGPMPSHPGVIFFHPLEQVRL